MWFNLDRAVTNNSLQHACIYISCYSTYLLKLEVQRYDWKQHDAPNNTCMLSIPIFTLLSSFKCSFKRKYLNLIDSICDVNESWPAVVFIEAVLATGPECIINIYVILGRRNLFEMGELRSARDQWRSQPDIWSWKCKFFSVYRP